MSIETEILRIKGARDTLRAKAVELKISGGTEKLDELAEDYDAIEYQGSISAQVKEGETYNIPKGYHDGTGTVSGVSGGGSYNLQSKQVTPTKKPQQVTPDGGYYGLSDVTVQAIPAQYQDVQSVTAVAADVLAGKVIVTSEGAVVPGTMNNNGAVSKKLSTSETSYTIPQGYHNGTGAVSITPETKSATPTKERQTVTPTAGSVLSSVTVEPIPAQYIETSDANAIADNLLLGKTAYVGGEKVTGTMPNNESVSKKLDASTTSFAISKGYHDGTGTVSVSVEEKSATPTKFQQEITPTSGKLLSKVTVKAIPAQYIETTDATAVAGDILTGKTAYVGGEKITGSMANNGDVTGTFDGLSTTSYEVPAGYTTGGMVSLTGEIESELAAI